MYFEGFQYHYPRDTGLILSIPAIALRIVTVIERRFCLIHKELFTLGTMPLSLEYPFTILIFLYIQILILIFERLLLCVKALWHDTTKITFGRLIQCLLNNTNINQMLINKEVTQ